MIPSASSSESVYPSQVPAPCAAACLVFDQTPVGMHGEQVDVWIAKPVVDQVATFSMSVRSSSDELTLLLTSAIRVN
jgi:hypothetical protein